MPGPGQKSHLPHDMTPEQQIKQLRTHSDAYGATDVQAMNNRVIALEQLYQLAGRHQAAPGLRSTYTNLWASIPDNL